MLTTYFISKLLEQVDNKSIYARDAVLSSLHSMAIFLLCLY